jgi:hypothetical protein
MSNVWAKLFGASALVERVADGADAIVFTPEERARHYIEVLKVIEPFKIAQRWLAIIVLIPYVLIVVISIGIKIGALFADDAKLFQVVSGEMLSDNNDNLGLPASLIIGFYFAGGALEGIIAKFKK